MDFTKQEFQEISEFTFDKISEIREKIVNKTYLPQDLKQYLGHCVICGLKKELKEIPNYETFSGIVQFIDEIGVE